MTWVSRNKGLIYDWWTWDGIDTEGAWQAIGASDEAASYVNLVTPGTFDLTVAAGNPGWTKAGGWSLDGSSYFDTGILASQNQTIMVMIADKLTGIAERIMGVDDTAVDFFFRSFSLAGGGTSLSSQVEYRYGTGNVTKAQTTEIGQRVIIGLNSERVYHSGNSTPVTENAFAGWSATALNHYLGASNGNVANAWSGNVLAAAIFNQVLTAAQMTQVANAMLILTSAHNPRPHVNYIAQRLGTKQLNSAAHELLIATNNGVYRSFNGGREWAKMILPDPSNAEFSDSPAATISELSFDWAAYSPVDSAILYLRAIKSSTSRIWIYKSSDNGLTWSSRGVVDSGSAAKDFDAAPMVSSPCDIDADESYLYLAALDATGFPVLIQLDTDLDSDGTIVFDPGAGTDIGVETGRFDADTIWIAGEFDSTNVVEKSEDAGSSFTVKDPGAFGAIGAFKVGPDSDLRVMVFDTDNNDLYETIDGGDNWTAINTSVTPTIRAIGRLGQNTQECVFGNASAASDNIDYSINSGEDLEDYSGGFPQVDVNGVVIN